MSLSIFLLWLVSIPFTTNTNALPPPRGGYHINCGSTEDDSISDPNYPWTADQTFINTGNVTTLTTPGLMPILSTLRFFPNKSARKYCYEIPVVAKETYLVRTMYYYGNYDGGEHPPVFDQIVDGFKWSVVNTTEDYVNGQSSYYEVVMVALEKRMSVCVARNEFTMSDPFISGIEVVQLEKSVYNTTDLSKNALSTVARHCFGYNDRLIRYPDDEFNRYWQPFTDNQLQVISHSNVTSTKFWNLPPTRIFNAAVTTTKNDTLDLDWPPGKLPRGGYYIALYFQDNRNPSPDSWRAFDVFVNGKLFYENLNVSDSGVTVISNQWPLSGLTTISMIAEIKSTVGPIINAGEVMQVVPLGKRTVARDVKAMQHIAKGFKNPPPDWRGDPCMPRNNSWTGVTCSYGKTASVNSLNLTGFGVGGELSPAINRLAGLTNIWLGGNNLTGEIPDLGRLHYLVSLRLEDNQFIGEIPDSLGILHSLREVFVQNNNLEGEVPETLVKKGVYVRYLPGNKISAEE